MRNTVSIVLAFLLTASTGCFAHDPYVASPGYLRDDVFCWHRVEGRWQVLGLSHECPENTPMGDPRFVKP